jgi:hypothetical protein
VGGQGAGLGTEANGIYSTADNVTVKNGIVRGFFQGIYLTGRGAVVQDVLADQNTYVGIRVSGLGALVEHNQVVDSGNSTITANQPAYGIGVEGPSSTVSNNIVSGLTATGSSYEVGIGIYNDNSTVRNNIISNTAIPSGGSQGIYQTGLDIDLNNTVSNFTQGVVFGNAGGDLCI